MRRHPIQSSALRSVGYDPARRILEAEFASGATYRYFGVPMEEFMALEEASSKGRYFTTRIRDRFPFAAVEQEKREPRRRAVAPSSR